MLIKSLSPIYKSEDLVYNIYTREVFGLQMSCSQQMQ